MFFLISILVGIFSYFEYHLSKIFKLRVFLLLIVGIFFFILFGYNSYSPDLENYKIHYDNFDQEYIKLRVEPAILMLMKVSQYYGLSFQGYQILFAFLTLSLFIFSIFKYSPLPIFVLFNFYFIPFFPDITQIRFFLGFSIFLFSLSYYQKNKLVYYLLLILSSMCHISLSILILFPIFRNFQFFKNQVSSNVIILTLSILIMTIQKSAIVPLVFLFSDKHDLYLESNDQTQIGTLVLFIPFFIINNIIIFLDNKYSSRFEILLEKKYLLNMKLLVDLIRFSNFVILFQLFVRDFSRINYNVYVIVIIYFTYIIYYYKNRSKLIASFVIAAVILYNLLLYYVQFYLLNNFQYFKVINETYLSNYLF